MGLENNANRLKDCIRFIESLEELTKEIDPMLLNRQLEAGVRLEPMTKSFFKKNQNFIESFPFQAHFRFPKCSNIELIEEDLRIMGSAESEIKADQDEIDPKAVAGKQLEKLSDDEIFTAARKAVATFYARACAACYLRLTFNKSRHNKEQDRREPLDLVRFAIRYDHTNYFANLWFMVAQGWYLDSITSTKERILLAKCFRLAIEKTSRLNPHEPLCYNLLGRFHFHAASMSWLERTVSNKLLGADLVGTYEEAEQNFLRSNELKPWLPNGLWMAKVLLARKRPMEEVKKWIDFGLSLEAEEATTEIERRELLELRSKLKLCSDQS